jgi:hypothetical protein
MQTSAELGQCDYCGKESSLYRKYYHYDIKCDCCIGDMHFHVVRHCKSCIPKPPSSIKIVLENINPEKDPEEKP